MRRVIINNFTTIFLVIIYLIVPFVFVRQANNNSICASDTQEDMYNLYPLIDKFAYETDEDIDLSFVVEADFNIKSIEYETDGFIVKEEPYYDNGIILIKFKYDGKSDNQTITLKVSLDNRTMLASKIYGIVENGVLYINANSFDAARDIYLSEALKNGSISEKEYEKILSDNNRSHIEHRSTSSGRTVDLPRNANGGWVTGTIRWKDDRNNYHPLQFTKVLFYDKNSIIDDELLGWTFTDENGDYLFSFDSNVDSDLDNTGRDIFVKIKPESVNSTVKTGTGNDYIYEDSLHVQSNVVTGALTEISFDLNDMSTDTNKAFQVSQAIITASRYASTMCGFTMDSVNVLYPHNIFGKGCYHQSGTIYIVGNRDTDASLDGVTFRSYESWDVIMHEYGHFVQYKFNINGSHGKTHWFRTNMYEHYMSHYSGPLVTDCDDKCAMPSIGDCKDYAIKIAYAEAWATVFSGMAQKYYAEILDDNIKTVGDEKYESYNGATLEYEDNLYRNEATEGAIIGILWDIFDNNNGAYDNDYISLDHNAFWSLSTTNNPKTFSEFTNNFYISLYNSYYDEYNQLLEDFGMAPTNIDISSTVVSHYSPTFSWTANGTSSSLSNDYFDIIISDCYDNIIVNTYSYSTSVSLTLYEWNSVINAYGDKFYVLVRGVQTSYPSTGFYYSSKYEFDKPEIETTYSSGEVEVTGYYSWTPSEVVIQSSYGGYPTTSIDASAFYGFSGLTEVTIPNSVTSIGAGAFENCTNLSYVSLPSYITSIEDETFKGCTSLEDIGIPSSVTSIGDEAFEGCTSLEDVYITSGVTSIGDSAFYGCSSLESIDIPSGVESIGAEAFKNCSSLTSVIVNNGNKLITSLGSNAFYGCPYALEIEVPQNRIADYKNATGWSSYRGKIVPDSNNFVSYDLEDTSFQTLPIYLYQGENAIIEFYVIDQNTYSFTYSSSYNAVLSLYDSYFYLIDSSGIISEELDDGETYYLTIEFVSSSSNGVVNLTYQKENLHVHAYNTYLWNSYTQHRKVCSCGSTLYEGHAINAGSLGPGQQYATCILCNGLASVGFIGPDSISQYPSTVNGSYILPNGVVVLVDEDIDAYLNGTLIFNYQNGDLQSRGIVPYLLKREDEDYLYIYR